MTIRKNNDDEWVEIFALIKKAFEDVSYSNHDEHLLVERLMKSNIFIPDLSLVAIVNDIIVGYILLTEIKIIQKDIITPSLSLAPLAVLPSYQGKGVGTALINAAHGIATEKQYGSIVVLGDEEYYPRFGYTTLSKYQLSLPFPSPEKNSMIIELQENNPLHKCEGIIEYPLVFFE